MKRRRRLGRQAQAGHPRGAAHQLRGNPRPGSDVLGHEVTLELSSPAFEDREGRLVFTESFLPPKTQVMRLVHRPSVAVVRRQVLVGRQVGEVVADVHQGQAVGDQPGVGGVLHVGSVRTQSRIQGGDAGVVVGDGYGETGRYDRKPGGGGYRLQDDRLIRLRNRIGGNRDRHVGGGRRLAHGDGQSHVASQGRVVVVGGGGGAVRQVESDGGVGGLGSLTGREGGGDRHRIRGIRGALRHSGLVNGQVDDLLVVGDDDGEFGRPHRRKPGRSGNRPQNNRLFRLRQGIVGNRDGHVGGGRRIACGNSQIHVGGQSRVVAVGGGGGAVRQVETDHGGGGLGSLTGREGGGDRHRIRGVGGPLRHGGLVEGQIDVLAVVVGDGDGELGRPHRGEPGRNGDRPQGDRLVLLRNGVVDGRDRHVGGGRGVSGGNSQIHVGCQRGVIGAGDGGAVRQVETDHGGAGFGSLFGGQGGGDRNRLVGPALLHRRLIERQKDRLVVVGDIDGELGGGNPESGGGGNRPQDHRFVRFGVIVLGDGDGHVRGGRPLPGGNSHRRPAIQGSVITGGGRRGAVRQHQADRSGGCLRPLILRQGGGDRHRLIGPALGHGGLIDGQVDDLVVMFIAVGDGDGQITGGDREAGRGGNRPYGHRFVSLDVRIRPNDDRHVGGGRRLTGGNSQGHVARQSLVIAVVGRGGTVRQCQVDRSVGSLGPLGLRQGGGDRHRLIASAFYHGSLINGQIYGFDIVVGEGYDYLTWGGDEPGRGLGCPQDNRLIPLGYEIGGNRDGEIGGSGSIAGCNVQVNIAGRNRRVITVGGFRGAVHQPQTEQSIVGLGPRERGGNPHRLIRCPLRNSRLVDSQADRLVVVVDNSYTEKIAGEKCEPGRRVVRRQSN